MATVLLEARPYRPFKSSEEYLYAMREDLAEWLNTMYPELDINVENFMDRLDTGVALCKHANNVRAEAEKYLVRRQARQKSMTKSMTSGSAGPILALGHVHYLPLAKSGTFFSRDNVSNFITWCRKGLHIFECLLFETDDLIMRKNEKHVILCLLEVARRGAKFGMLAPMLVQMERQIDREIAADNRANGVGCGTQTESSGSNTASTGTDTFGDSDSEDEESEDAGPPLVYGPMPQIITNDLKSLDEMVRDLVERCTCPSQFPMIRVSEGKYRIGDTKILIFVRILRSHVMVRVGGGWDTLSHYLDKHDPCRCRASHRSALKATIQTRTNPTTNGIELKGAQVFYDRSPPVARKFNAQSPSAATTPVAAVALSPPLGGRSRSRSPSKMSPPMSVARSASPNLKRLVKKTSFENSVTIPIAATPQEISVVDGVAKEPTEGASKYDNTSDNGSEISDEGYRSLGLIQNGTNKRASMHSQASNEDAENTTRLETTSSDSQVSPCDEQCLKIVESEVIEPPAPVAEPLTPLAPLEDKFAKSGIVITDDEITVDISSATGLRKTGFSEQIYSGSPKKSPVSRIPRSPLPVRRKSVDNLCMTETTPESQLSRKIPQYRSVRKPTTSSLAKETPATPTKENTWSGRSQKRRPSIGNETYQQPPQQSHSKPNSPSPNRKALARPPVQYDQNGRRIKPISASANTSPIKGRIASPLAQQFLEVAGEAKDDAQFLAKMKALLAQYTKNEGNFDDFTTAWVNGNGNVDHRKTTPTPEKEPKRTGLSRIPAPVRSNTGLY